MPTDGSGWATRALSIERLKLVAFLGIVVGTGFSISMCGIGLGAYLILLLLQVFFFRKENIESFPYFHIFLALFASLVISVYISSYFFVSLRGLWKYLEGFLLLYAVIDILRERRLIRILIATFGMVVLIAAWDGIFQDRTGHDLFYERALLPHKQVETEPLSDVYIYLVSRITGPFKHSNDYATFLLPGFLILLSTFLYFLKKRHWAGAILLLLGLASVFYSMLRTLSLGMFVSLIAAILFFACCFPRRWLTLTVVVAALAALLIIPSGFGDRAKNALNMKYPNTQARIILFQTAARMVGDSPFFGLGLNTYSKHFPEYKPPEYPAVMYAHNAYIQMAAEAGWVGLALYMAYVGRLFFAALRRLTSHLSDFRFFYLAGFMAAIVGFLVNCLFDSCLQSTQLRTLFWMLMGTAFVLAQRGEPGNARGAEAG